MVTHYATFFYYNKDDDLVVRWMNQEQITDEKPVVGWTREKNTIMLPSDSHVVVFWTPSQNASDITTQLSPTYQSESTGDTTSSSHRSYDLGFHQLLPAENRIAWTVFEQVANDVTLHKELYQRFFAEYQKLMTWCDGMS